MNPHTRFFTVVLLTKKAFNRDMWFSVAIFILTASAATPAVESPSLLEKHIKFWEFVYSDLSLDEVVIHDAVEPWVILERFRSPSSQFASREAKLEKWRQHFRKQGDWRKAHRRRLRYQRGMKEDFVLAQKKSAHFQKKIQRGIRKCGGPSWIGYLPYVESSFENKALSKVEAAGLFQIMQWIMPRKASAQDPEASAWMACRLIEENYRVLRDWKLAITAYNSGKNRIFRLKIASGSESLEDLMALPADRRFGFASRNFYATFAAILRLLNVKGP